MGPATYTFNFNPEHIAAWLENEARAFETINRMYDEELQSLGADLGTVIQEHASRFNELDEMWKRQFDDLLYDTSVLWGETFKIEYPDEAMGLAAKVEMNHGSTASYLDYLMYAGAAAASLGIFGYTAHKFIEQKKNVDVNTNGSFERLI